MHKKFEINRTKIKGSCQLCRKVVSHNSKSDLPLVIYSFAKYGQKTTQSILIDLNPYLFCEDVSPNLGFLVGQLDGEHIGHMNLSCKLCTWRNLVPPFLHNQL